jgi:hypothetical protein
MKYFLRIACALESPGTSGGVGFVWVSWVVGLGRVRMSATATVWDGGAGGDCVPWYIFSHIFVYTVRKYLPGVYHQNA